MTLKARLSEIARSSDLAAIGFCTADPFPEVEDSLRDAVVSGRSASLGFTFTAPMIATDPRASFPWAETLVVVAYPYLPAAGRPPSCRRGAGRVARFATEDHYVPLLAVLDGLRGVLEEAGFRAAVMFDDNRLVDRAVAVRSGIAWWGKSTMVLTPGTGPWILLGSIVTDADIPYDEPMQRNCGLCEACIPACPTGAIVAPGVLDSRRCLAAMAQSPGSIPVEFRDAMGDRFYGCDDCLTVCPPGERLAVATSTESGGVDLLEILATADRPLRRRFGHFYVPRNEARFLRRNAIVALGNAGGTRFIGVLAGLLGHPDGLLRAHAAWALGRGGGPIAAAALNAARITEHTAEVLAEIDRALVMCRADDTRSSLSHQCRRDSSDGEDAVVAVSRWRVKPKG